MGGPVIDAAMKRALLGGVLVALSTFFVMLPQTDDWKLLTSAVGGGFVGVLISRLGIEGTYDLNRANAGNVNAGDVPVASDKVNVTKAP
jgi:hypothetical protein